MVSPLSTLNSEQDDYLARRNICAAVADTEAGINMLRLLCRISGWNKPSMTMEDAARRDVYLTLRQYIPAEKLAQIEHIDLLMQQDAAMQDLMQKFEEDLPTLG